MQQLTNAFYIQSPRLQTALFMLFPSPRHGGVRRGTSKNTPEQRSGVRFHGKTAAVRM